MLPAGVSITQALSFINANKVQHRTLPQMGGPGSVKSSGESSSQSGREIKWIQPSGPRRSGEGVENEEQGIISADQPSTGAVVLRITLLAAGFVIGPSGATVRDIMRVSGSDIRSWTEHPGARSRRPCRVFVLEGEESDILTAMTIITAAIDRYKDLCEGRCCGQAVGRVQRIMGVEFSYQPPPKNVVPFAAALKGHVQRPARTTGNTASSNFDALLQTPQHHGYMLTGNPSGGMASYFSPYSNLLVPPSSPTMLPYPAIYGLALPASHSGSGGGGVEGDYVSGSSLTCGYDYSHSTSGGGNTAGSDATSGMYIYPGGPMSDAYGAAAPGSPTPGWVMGSNPMHGMMQSNMMMPPSPIRYHGLSSSGASMSMPMGIDPMGIQGSYVGCSPLTPDISWQMGPHSGQHLQVPGSSIGTSSKMISAETPSTLPQGSLGNYDFMNGMGPHPMYGQPLLWYNGSPGGSPSRTISSNRQHPISPGSRLNPRAAPWSQSSRKDYQSPREHLARSHQPQHRLYSQPVQQQQQPVQQLAPPVQQQLAPPVQQQQAPTEQKQLAPPAELARPVQLVSLQPQPQPLQEQQLKIAKPVGAPAAPDQNQERVGLIDKGNGCATSMDQATIKKQSSASTATATDSNKENQHMAASSEPILFLAKTPKRPSSVSRTSDTRTTIYTPTNPDLLHSMTTPPQTPSFGSIPPASSCGSCSAPTGTLSTGPNALASGSVMVSPADPLISPSRFSYHKGQQRVRSNGSSNRPRQPNFASESEVIYNTQIQQPISKEQPVAISVEHRHEDCAARDSNAAMDAADTQDQQPSETAPSL